MKPLRIVCHNFGAIPHAEIGLEGLTATAVCGSNGAGKSTAFTIAPMFALYGTTKPGCSADDMVRTGTTEAAVTFDFEHHGDVWRVIRTRSTKGKGKTTLELQRRSGDLWATESGATIAETQKKIIDLINLDEETFLASSMIMQNDSSNFTKRPAGQRKAVLAQVLQLEQYDILQERAKAKVSAVNMELAGVKAKVEGIDIRLAARPGLEADKLAAELKLAEYADAIAKVEPLLQQAQTELATITARAEQVDKVREQATAAGQEAITKGSERDRQAGILQKAELMLGQEATILAKADEYVTTRDRITQLKALQPQQRTLAAEGNRLRTELAQVAEQLVKAATDIAHLEANEADRPRLEAAKADHVKAVADLADCMKRRDEHQRRLQIVKDCENQLFRAEDNYLGKEKAFDLSIAELKSKMAMLLDSNCIDIGKAKCAFLADAIAARDKVPTVEAEHEQWKLQADREIRDLQKALKAAQDDHRAYGFDPLEPYELQNKVDTLKPQADLYDQLDKAKPLLDNLRTQRDDLAARKADLETRFTDAGRQHKDLTDRLTALIVLETALAILEPWTKSKEQLPAARQAADTAREAITRLDGEIAAATARAEALQKELEAAGDIERLQREAESKVTTHRNLQSVTRELHTKETATLGGIQAQLTALDKDEATRADLVAEMEPLAKQLTRWQTLVKAFGRDGIQALILENAVPELERIANDILGQMSGGKHYLRFETQRELKSKAGMAETLEIIVGDWAGERKYETFSGGEQLRIDFALRFALAELLTRRAGNKIDWLVIDEGFGSQSDEYLPMVLDAVKEVTNRFGLVIVISHVRAVQEAFEQKIVFRPTGESVEVLAA